MENLWKKKEKQLENFENKKKENRRKKENNNFKNVLMDFVEGL